ncbi:MAG: Minf_1886 family protein [Sedimentisphaerales bacterium]
MKKKLEEIAREDSRFSPNALKFVYEGLGYTAKKIPTEPHHVTGQTLCEGLRKLAIEKWGRLAMLTLRVWNIKTTRDFGEIVYLMIKHGWMSAQPTDSIDDFNDVYDFKTVFKDQFKF